MTSGSASICILVDDSSIDANRKMGRHVNSSFLNLHLNRRMSANFMPTTFDSSWNQHLTFHVFIVTIKCCSFGWAASSFDSRKFSFIGVICQYSNPLRMIPSLRSFTGLYQWDALICTSGKLAVTAQFNHTDHLTMQRKGSTSARSAYPPPRFWPKFFNDYFAREFKGEIKYSGR